MNFLSLDDFTEDQLTEIFEIADHISRDNSLLKGKSVILFFPESSIRTRISFEKGVHDLGGQPILFPPEALDKREELRDVFGYIENWADLAVIRHSDFRRIQDIAEISNIPVINAMSSSNHPCEILSDLYGIRKLNSHYRSLNYTYVGPGGNILQSWINIAKVMNLSLTHAGPAGEKVQPEDGNYRFTTDLDPVLPGTDVLLTDPLPDCFRTADYYKSFQITEKRAAMLPERGIINPCPPFYRGEEVSAEAIESEKFVGYGFKKSLLDVQKALIRYCSARGPI